MIRKKFGVYSILLCFIFVITIFTACGNGKKDTSSVVNIKLNEVARSAFYAPMYVAINKGMFKEQGINIDLTTGQGADTTTTKTQTRIALITTPFYSTLRQWFIVCYWVYLYGFSVAMPHNIFY
ncbi:ABC transporter substrate-binding protein [Clostridium luticellarii]|uniref:NMT1/THI5 like protein n=1 Tax=Clostridium luticellarii TaxID=1691940 RepID=A0A2T0BQ67_9CLOT|nr:ABC transporter substrate-binding protein [Clostridium luticellarii]PRR86020.1 hypothetical protein CLLU_10480 [Clostridium luticellarii]